MPFFQAKDATSLFYKDWGAGRSVVFVHGGQLGSDMWEYQLPYLVDHGLRCVAYDRRGCGRSDQPGHGYEYDTLADDLAALVEHLDLVDVTLVGYSNGGGDVTRYLARHGAGRVARVVLIAPTTPFLLQTEDNPDGVDKGVFDAMIAELRQDRAHYTAATAPDFFGVGLANVVVSPELIQWGVALALQASPKATIDMTRAMAVTDFRPDMGAFTMPTLVIHGDADRTVPLEVSGRKTAQAIPRSRLVVYEGAAHGLFFTEKDRLNRDLLEFILS